MGSEVGRGRRRSRLLVSSAAMCRMRVFTCKSQTVWIVLNDRSKEGGRPVRQGAACIGCSVDVLELSEELVEHSLDGIPSGELGGEVFLGNGKISLSLLSGGFGVGDVLDALGKGGSVLDDSLSGVINGLLGDGHEVGVGSELVGFSGHGVGDTLDHLGSDSSELLSKSTEHLGVGEIGKLDEGLDHGTVFGVGESLRDLLEGSLDLGDLDHGGGTGVETGEELDTLIDSVDGHVGFLDVSGVLGVVLGSLSGSHVHLGEGVDDELLISGNLGLEGSLKWVEDVLKGGGSHGDIRFGGGDSLPM